MAELQNRDANHLPTIAGQYLQVWEFVFQGLNIGKWSAGKH